MKCSNCDKPALWVYKAESIGDTPYCEGCLPSFLRSAARAGLLAKADGYAAIEAEVAEVLAAPAPKKRRKDEPVEEPVAEETVVEAPAAEEPVEG